MKADRTITLHPHRSLSPAASKLLQGSVIGLSVLFSAAFSNMKLWPVALATTAPAIGVVLAMRANNRAAREHEIIEINRDELKITYFAPNGREKFICSLQPAFTHVAVDESGPEEEGYRTKRLVISSRGKSFEIGKFLPPAEKAPLAAVLQSAVLDARKAELV